MSVQDFIENFRGQLLDGDSVEITPGTEFRNLAEWSSLTALVMIGMADDIYGAALSDEDIRNSKTIEDLFRIVTTKRG